MTECCIKGFRWEGAPTGEESKLGENDTYITGSNKEIAILVVSDVFGWTFKNTRLLADAYAKETGATVYIPDFFGGEVVSPSILRNPGGPAAWEELGFDVAAFNKRNSKDKRWPELLSCARALRSQYDRVGVIGYCFGGWSLFRLGAASLNYPQKLVDCISTAHPTFLTKEEIDEIGVPVQIVAPEHDQAFTPEMKAYAMSVIPTKGVPFDYQHFPGVEHSFATRGNPDDDAERRAMVRAKRAQVGWMREWLHDGEE